MATKPDTIHYLMEQLSSVNNLSAQKMFGEYALYCEDKVVALVCDDQLYLKPTEGGRRYIGDVLEATAHSGAKSSFLISGDLWKDACWLSKLVKVTAQELSSPKAKKPRKAAS